jgi:hypothetical protein
MISKLTELFIIALSAIAVTSSQGAILASWDFTGQPGNQVLQAVSTTVSNISAGDLSRGSGLNENTTMNSINSGSWTSSAFDANDYYQFSLTVAPGFQMDLDSVDFAERRSGTGIRNFQIRSSLDSYGALIGAAVGVPDDDLVRNQSMVLNSAFDMLTGTVTFRIYGTDAEGAAGTWRLHNHGTTGGLTIQGTVTAIPELSSSLLGCLGMSLLLRRRR